MVKECIKHGLTSHFVRSDNGKYRCKKCMVEMVSKRRREIKLKSIEYKGGKCSKCGYDKCVDALDFHHVGNKNFGIAKSGYTRSWEKIKAELDKCILVCANCHREIHSNLISGELVQR